ncbi:hypothetical protein CTAYLR_000167 [Chrysophaeum taylorii]|uniref:Glycosyl transferase CAP10 domain-containing protein n=1 Tax=Chrysophaeum taylorii TaxID=2483200 RepID=A0AAD7UGY5_9STRA|nr:hypothetical protein CTAYLR_000167 [Chrysophaeum taylorii]
MWASRRSSVLHGVSVALFVASLVLYTRRPCGDARSSPKKSEDASSRTVEAEDGTDWRAQAARSLEVIDAEIARSIALGFPFRPSKEATWDFVEAIIGLPEYSVIVLNNKIFFSREFLRVVKHIKHASFVRTALDRRPSKNVVYQFEGGASGPQNRFECGLEPEWHKGLTSVGRDKPFRTRFDIPVPRLCISKREGYDKCGILVPNPYIGNLTEWKGRLRKIGKAAAAAPFPRRDSRLFWRGSISTPHEGCPRELGNFARFSAATLTHVHPTRVDVRCPSGCNPRNDDDRPCPEFPYDRQMKDALRHLDRLKGQYVKEKDYTNYKYVLNLPGSTTGSYSRNLNHLWMLGSVVFLWQNAHVEWYYPALQHGLTHLEVNKSTVVRELDRLDRDPVYAKKLINGAKMIDQTVLCPDCLATYLHAVFAKLRSHFKLGPLLDSRDNFRQFLAERNCSSTLVEFLHVDSRNKTILVKDLSSYDNCTALYDVAYDRIHPPLLHLPYHDHAPE